MAEESKKESQPPVTLQKPQFSKVDQLSPASVGFNLIVKVGKIQPIMNRLNLDGTRLRISEAVIGDKTACIILSLRNGKSSFIYFHSVFFCEIAHYILTTNIITDQIGMVEEGNCLILRNAKIDMVNNGYMRVAIDRWGLIEKVDEAQNQDEINTKNNLSEVELLFIYTTTH